MRRSYLCLGLGGAAALLAAVAACQGHGSAPVAAPPASVTLDELLTKLDALKARQEALDQEVRETRALLNEKYVAIQMRMAKAGRMTPVAAPFPPCAMEYPSGWNVPPPPARLVPIPVPSDGPVVPGSTGGTTSPINRIQPITEVSPLPGADLSGGR